MSDDKHKHRRRSTPKTRGGCQTCRSRHIRCMQEKPVCRNCDKGRRQCIYGPPQPCDALRIISWRNPSPGPPASVSATNWKTAELHFLQRFQTQCCASLRGHFPNTFWDRIIHQGSENSASIRNAVVALTLVWDSSRSADPSHIKEGLSRYNKAVRELRLTLYSRRAVAIEEALLCNVLFVCIEIYRQNYEIALEQLSSGLYLFCEWNRECAGKDHSQTGSSEMQNTISTIYRKLLAQATLFITDHSATRQIFNLSSVLASRPVPHRFRDLCDAKECLLDLTSAMIHRSLSRQAAHSHVAALANETARPLSRLDICQLQSFSMAYYRSLDPPSKVHVKERVQQITIEAQLLGFEILALVRHQDEPEWAYDEHRDSFARIITLANEAYTLTSHTYKDPKGLTFDMEIVPLLYLTAGRCRDSALRRVALKLLRAFTKQEGLWNGNMLAAVAEYIIDAEESLIAPGHTETARLTLLDVTIMSDAKNLIATFLVKCWAGSRGTLLHETIAY